LTSSRNRIAAANWRKFRIEWYLFFAFQTLVNQWLQSCPGGLERINWAPGKFFLATMLDKLLTAEPPEEMQSTETTWCQAIEINRFSCLGKFSVSKLCHNYDSLKNNERNFRIIAGLTKKARTNRA
jgi:hypothetical protein